VCQLKAPFVYQKVTIPTFLSFSLVDPPFDDAGLLISFFSSYYVVFLFLSVVGGLSLFFFCGADLFDILSVDTSLQTSK